MFARDWGEDIPLLSFRPAERAKAADFHFVAVIAAGEDVIEEIVDYIADLPFPYPALLYKPVDDLLLGQGSPGIGISTPSYTLSRRNAVSGLGRLGLLGKRVYLFGDSGLLSCGGLLLHNALSGRGIDGLDETLVDLREVRMILVLGIHGCDDLLHGGSHRRFDLPVAAFRLLVRFDSLLCRPDVSHVATCTIKD